MDVPARTNPNQDRIEIRNLSFRYGENLPFLFQNLDITLEPGKVVALMGPSGSGKSTLAKLLLGFYQPAEGRIKLDGHDIRHLSANELRQHFGVVPQETTLFSGTIYDNLLLANPQACFEDVVQACKLAEIHETIQQLPEGYQAEIGEQARDYPAVRSKGSRSQEHCSRGRRCRYSMRGRAISIRRRRSSLRRLLTCLEVR